MTIRPPKAPVRLAFFKQPLIAKPVCTSFGPGGMGPVAFAHAKAVRRGSIDVQFRRNAGPLERQIHEDAMLGWADDIVATVDQKNGGRVLRDAEAGRQLVLVLGFQISRIHGDGEIGTTTYFVNFIGWL